MTCAKPDVSVVVATRNRARLLERLLGALAQERVDRHVEIVIVDDGSTDDTSRVVRAAGLRLVGTSGVGPAGARNAGWHAARGAYVAFTDDDCVPPHDWLARLLAPLDNDAAVDGVGGPIVPLSHGFFEDFEHAEGLANHGIAADGSVRYLVTANAAYRRSALERVGGFDESFPNPAGEDVDLARRVQETGGVLRVATGSPVAHDYRRGVRQLVRTYWRHGTARAELARRYDELAPGPAARSAASVGALTARYQQYRRSVGPLAAAGYLAMRVLCLGVFGFAVALEGWRGQCTPRA
jgi:GT2 family glycosyltransferase